MANERKLSCFFARELLALKMQSPLDKGREGDLGTHLRSCKACVSYSEQLNRGLRAVEALKSMQPSPGLLAFISEEHHLVETIANKLNWRFWPVGLRWAGELALLALILVGILEVFPWARVIKKIPTVAVQKAEVPMDTGVEPTATPPTGALTTVAARPVVVAIAPTPEPSPGTTVVNTAAAAAEDEASTKGEEKGQGFLYRGEMTVANPLEESDPVRLSIESLGGERAGQVRLGWKRESGRYYHFTIPENNYEAMLVQLRAMGDLEIHKETHPRVMPKGVIRVILTVEEPGDHTNEDNESSTPGKSDE